MNCFRRKIKYIIPLAILVLSLIILLRPAGKITFDKTVSENRFLLQYEIEGCGSLIRKVVDGGEEITEAFKNECPDIGTNEIKFSKESDEPLNHMDRNTMGGYPGKYTFVVEGSSVGVTKGAPECCSENPAYNEKVAEFKVDNWYYTSYVPFIFVGDFAVILLGYFLGFVSLLWFFILTVIKFIR